MTARRLIPRADVLICLAILLATFAAYARVFRYGFLGYDDGAYIIDNTHLSAGLAYRNLNWIFLSFLPDNWFPVTRLSYILDYRFFGLRAAGYHVENVVIHALAALLLFGFLRRATGTRWAPAFTACVFALHPLHVESVAWVAERKDVLCALFWFTALWAWLRYTERPGPARYAQVLVLFSLGLMSKPMIVTFPFLLFVLDFWPLRRPYSRKLITEKIPLLALSGAVMAVTMKAQAVPSLSDLLFSLRLKNALVSIASYLSDTFWPARLWAPYAYPEFISIWPALAAAVGVVAVTALAIAQRRTRPWLAAGWFWFLGTLIPVIGLISAGDQARADRYMYVPLVGIAIAFAWAAAELGARWPRIRPVLAVLGVALCIAMSVRTSFQTRYWETTDGLFLHAIEMDRKNYLAWNLLGDTFSEDPQYIREYIAYYRQATDIRPDFALAHNNLGVALTHARRIDEAIEQFETAFSIRPDYAAAHYNLGSTFAALGRNEDALREFEEAVRIFPALTRAHTELGTLLLRTPGRAAEGTAHLAIAVRLDPDYAPAQNGFGWALMNAPGRQRESIVHFREALRMNPRYLAAHVGLATALLQLHEDKAEAIAHLKAAQEIRPDAARQLLLDGLQQPDKPVPPDKAMQK